MSIGQRLILGIDKPYLSQSETEFISQKQIGGIILFDRNGVDLTQLKKLTEEIRSATDSPPFIAIDFEGGRVRRMRELFGPIEKPAAYINNLPKLEADCLRVAKQFVEVGINANFAPVADLGYSPLNPALNDRVYSNEPHDVTDYCKSFIKNFKSEGIACCLKHFPGLGSAVNDPHAETAVSCLPLSHLKENDFIPYKAGFVLGVEMMMTSHILMSCLDNKIATFSKSTTRLLREMGFNGIIITDDLSMGAVKDDRPLEEVVLESLCAGHDLALICHDFERHLRVVEHLENNIGLIERNGHQQALARITDAKNKIPKRNN